jgi:LacI family transcriptional regulator
MASTSPPENPARRTRLKDIAAHAGVSVATVSRVLNGRPDVAHETRELVLAAARAQGPTVEGRLRRRQRPERTRLVGVTLPIINSDYYATMLNTIAESLYELDMRLVACPAGELHDREHTLLELLADGTTDGGILILPFESADELEALRRRGYPFVVLDTRGSVPDGIPTVAAAHVRGAQLAVEHLLELGHRRIGTITGPTGLAATSGRLAGYRAALAGYELLPPDELIRQGDHDLRSGRVAAEALLALDERPTAIFAFNDWMAIGALHAALARGLRVPEDISIVGFDDADAAQVVIPPLTTVRQPIEDMARLAVTMLRGLLEGQELATWRVELGASLVVRESTAPPPANVR